MTPKYLKDNLPLVRNPPYGRNNTNFYHNIHCNTTRFMNSFYPDAVKSWNNLGDEFNSCKSIKKFKNDINNLIRPLSKPVFSIYDPKRLKYLFQLRVSLSALKHHKKRHNFADTPFDLCDCNCAPEDTCHFLFHCNLYTLQRRNLINSVTQILLPYPDVTIFENTDLFLYGHPPLSNHDNRLILLSTIKFIRDTGRFNV